MINFSLPNLSEIETLRGEKDTQKLKSYLTQLTENLKFTLNNIDLENLAPELYALLVGNDSIDSKVEKLKVYTESMGENFVNKFNETNEAIASSGLGKPIGLKSSQRIEDDEELTTEIAKVYDAMTDGETKLIAWYGYPSTGGNGWFGILSRSSINNGGVTAHSAYGGGSLVVKTKYRTTWQELEWENPPMEDNVEYRTTERHLGEPVYRKRVTVPTLGNASQTNVSFSTRGANIFETVASAQTTGGTKQMFPVATAAGAVRARLHFTNASLIINTLDDMSSYSAVVSVRYTKA